MKSQIRTFGDWFRWDETFRTDWLPEAVDAILVPDDYWLAAMFEYPKVVKIPAEMLDRNEILLLFKRQPILSVSWNMPLIVTSDGIRVVAARGWANCLVCTQRVAVRPGGVNCGPHGELALANTDMGLCPWFRSLTGPLRMDHAPVWWQDSDWVLEKHRYQAAAFNVSAASCYVVGHTPMSRLRHNPIPKTLAETPLHQRPERSTKETWMAFFEQVLGNDVRDIVLVQAQGMAYTANGESEHV